MTALSLDFALLLIVLGVTGLGARLVRVVPEVLKGGIILGAALAAFMQIFDFAAGGFRDFTRIASSNPPMWCDIALENRQALLRQLAAFEKTLQDLKRWLKEKDEQSMLALFERAKAARDSIELPSSNAS